jgi:formylglycine-generating enzyme required for sulfatase activity
MGDYAWYASNAGMSTQTVAHKHSNAYGLYDMGGNVYEWCNDWHSSYSSGPATNPTGPSSGTHRVYRGGGWDSNSAYVKSAYRFYNGPKSGLRSYGIRVVLPAQ